MLQWWIFLHLLMREISSLMSRGMRSSLEDFFCDLNRDVLGPLGDGKIIILSDSNEEEEVCEKNAADVEGAPSSTIRSPASTASVDGADGTYKSNTPDRATGGCSSGGD
jgi:hypothetical protein